MLREIVTPQEQDYILHIPKEYLNTKVEILVLPFVEEENEITDNTTSYIRKTSGILSSQNIDPLAWQKMIREEWKERV